MPDDNVTAWNPLLSSGMTLRDWFAGQALGVIVEQYAEANGGVGHDHLPRNCAAHAYRVADAMLKARREDR